MGITSSRFNASGGLGTKGMYACCQVDKTLHVHKQPYAAPDDPLFDYTTEDLGAGTTVAYGVSPAGWISSEVKYPDPFIIDASSVLYFGGRGETWEFWFHIVNQHASSSVDVSVKYTDSVAQDAALLVLNDATVAAKASTAWMGPYTFTPSLISISGGVPTYTDALQLTFTASDNNRAAGQIRLKLVDDGMTVPLL